MVDASSPVFWDVSDWPDNDDNDAAGIDRILKVVCEDADGNISEDEQVSSNNERWRVAESDTLDEDTLDLPESEFVHEIGEPIIIGEHGADDFLFERGEPVNNADESDFAFQSGVGLGGSKADLDYMAGVEDSSDFDYYDSNTHWSEAVLDSRGYVRVVLEHGRSSIGHKVWLGENRADGYLMDDHPGDMSDEVDTGQIMFEGRMYENGDVTDPEGNFLGTWK